VHFLWIPAFHYFTWTVLCSHLHYKRLRRCGESCVLLLCESAVPYSGLLCWNSNMLRVLLFLTIASALLGLYATAAVAESAPGASTAAQREAFELEYIPFGSERELSEREFFDLDYVAFDPHTIFPELPARAAVNGLVDFNGTDIATAKAVATVGVIGFAANTPAAVLFPSAIAPTAQPTALLAAQIVSLTHGESYSHLPSYSHKRCFSFSQLLSFSDLQSGVSQLQHVSYVSFAASHLVSQLVSQPVSQPVSEAVSDGLISLSFSQPASASHCHIFSSSLVPTSSFSSTTSTPVSHHVSRHVSLHVSNFESVVLSRPESFSFSVVFSFSQLQSASFSRITSFSGQRSASFSHLVSHPVSLPVSESVSHVQSTSFSQPISFSGVTSTSFSTVPSFSGLKSTSFSTVPSFSGLKSTSFSTVPSFSGLKSTSFSTVPSFSGLKSNSFSNVISLPEESISFSHVPSFSGLKSTSFSHVPSFSGLKSNSFSTVISLPEESSSFSTVVSLPEESSSFSTVVSLPEGSSSFSIVQSVSFSQAPSNSFSRPTSRVESFSFSQVRSNSFSQTSNELESFSFSQPLSNSFSHGTFSFSSHVNSRSTNLIRSFSVSRENSQYFSQSVFKSVFSHIISERSGFSHLHSSSFSHQRSVSEFSGFSQLQSSAPQSNRIFSDTSVSDRGSSSQVFSASTPSFPVSFRGSFSVSFPVSFPVSFHGIFSVSFPVSFPVSSPVSSPVSAGFVSQPSPTPTRTPTYLPGAPTPAPSHHPSAVPTYLPGAPTPLPTETPSVAPTYLPGAPTPEPTAEPSSLPTYLPGAPTPEPTVEPSSVPTYLAGAPTPEPTAEPSSAPTYLPGAPTPEPTSAAPTYALGAPTPVPTASPTTAPTYVPGTPTPDPTNSAAPTYLPGVPTPAPTTSRPSAAPTYLPGAPTPAPTAYPPLELVSKAVFATYVDLTFSFSTVAMVKCSPYASGKAPSSESELNFFAFSATSSVSSSGSYLATVAVTGLTPLASYDIYCYSEDFEGDRMPLAAVLAFGPISVTTIFGRTITVSVGLAAIVLGGTQASAIGLTLDYAPDTALTVAVSVVDANNQAYPLYPPSVSFTSASLSLSASFSITSSVTAIAGNRTVNITLSGASASEYYRTPSFANGVSMFTVLALGQSPPAPKLLAAQFSNSGSRLFLTLNSPALITPTLPSTFTCSQLFTFGGASSSSCSASSSSSFVVYLSPTATVKPRSTLSMVPGTYTVSAVCASTVTRCKTAGTSSVSVLSPAIPLVPSVSLTAPNYLSNRTCTPFSVDASSSTGSGGRAWSNVTVTVSSSSGNVTTVNRLLKSYQITKPTLLSSNQFTPGSYTFLVKLCNFFALCTTATSTLVVVGSGVIPLTTIYGSQSQTTTRNLQFRLTYDSYTTACGGAVSRSNLVSSLVVSRGSSVVSFPGVQKQPGAFSLPAYTFLAYDPTMSNVYTLALTMTYTLSPLTPATVYAYVTVVQSGVLAVIRGGSTQGVRVGTTATVDGSRSYDPDQDLYGSRAGLTFVFGCTQLTPSFSPNCSFVSSAGDTPDQRVFGAPDSSLQTSSTITMTVSDPTRSGSASMVLQGLSSRAPLVGLMVANNGATTVNAVNALSLAVSVKYLLNTAIRLTCAGITLSTMSPQPTSKNMTGAGSYVTTFVIPPNNLPQGTTLSFVLTAFSSGQTLSTSSVSITVNLPPQPGFYSTTPSVGTAQSTSYLFSASNWQSQQLPLSYSFGVIAAGNFLPLQSYSELATMYSILPQGNDVANYMVTTACFVLDSLQASSEATDTIQVNPNSNPKAGLEAMNSLLASGDTSKAVCNGAASLNTVSCAGAPNCALLHRSNCSTVANTCGACLSGYLGPSGASNAACTRGPTLSAAAHSMAKASCETSDDCPAFYSCNKKNKCVLREKTCLNSCSNGGECVFQDVNFLSKQTVSTCYANNPLCVAVCQCNSTRYGDDCSLSLEGYVSQIDQREVLLEVVYNATQTSDVTLANVQSWLSTVLAVAQGGLVDMPDQGMTAFYNLVSFILTAADEVDAYYTYLDDIMTLIDLAATAASSSDRRRLTLDQEFESNYWFTLQRYAQVVMKSLGDGISFSQYLDRYAVTFTGQSSEVNQSSFLSPVSEIDSIYGDVKSQVINFTSPVAVMNKFAVVTWRASAFPSSTSAYFLSNPVSVIVEDISSCAEGGCDVQYYFENYADVEYARNTTTYTTQCKRGQHTSTTYPCPSNLTVTAECPGNFDGSIISTCPYYKQSPYCAKADLFGSGVESWSPESYTNTSTTCNVTLFAAEFEGLVNETAGSIDVMPIMAATLVTTPEIIHKIQHVIDGGVIIMTILMLVLTPLLGWLIWKSCFRGFGGYSIQNSKPSSEVDAGKQERVKTELDIIDGADIELAVFDPDNDELIMFESEDSEDNDNDDDGDVEDDDDDNDLINTITVTRVNRHHRQSMEVQSGAFHDEIPAPAADHEDIGHINDEYDRQSVQRNPRPLLNPVVDCDDGQENDGTDDEDDLDLIAVIICDPSSGGQQLGDEYNSSFASSTGEEPSFSRTGSSKSVDRLQALVTLGEDRHRNSPRVASSSSSGVVTGTVIAATPEILLGISPELLPAAHYSPSDIVVDLWEMPYTPGVVDDGADAASGLVMNDDETRGPEMTEEPIDSSSRPADDDASSPPLGGNVEGFFASDVGDDSFCNSGGFMIN
jgi:hypothetical protein